jgi:O-acetylhomoserine/O-acetylserine sulfhydrylase
LQSVTYLVKNGNGKEQLAVGIDPALFRVSAGIEHIDDIINDFEQAFKQVL